MRPADCHGTGVRLPPGPFDSSPLRLAPQRGLAHGRPLASGGTLKRGRVECPERAQRVEGQECPLALGAQPSRPSIYTRVFRGLASFHVYLLRCADGTFYAGSCEHLADRGAAHNRGEGANWTAKRLPVDLVYSESFPTRAEAIAREKQLKRWCHAKKAALAAGNTDRLRALAKRRN